MIGGLIQVISSLAFSAYLENSPPDAPIFISSTSRPLSLILDGEQQFIVTRFNKSANGFGNPNQSKSQNGIHTSVGSLKTDRDKLNGNGRSFLNTKILYKPYTPNALDDGPNAMDKSSASSNGKAKTINSTVYKSVTPSITDRVIADLKKEEYLNQQRAKADINGIEVGENDEAIYIDGDDEETTPDSITEIETSVEKLPDEPTPEQPDGMRSDVTKRKPAKKMPQTIGSRDKKSSKKPTIVNQKYKSFGFVDISDTDSSEAVDIDDDDYDDDINSGSGDFSIQSAEQTSVDWVAPTIEKIKAKKLNKQERIMKSFADNTYGMSDSSKEVDTDPVDFIDKNDDQMISRKIAKAHKKQSAIQTATKTENQKPKPKQNNRQKSNTNNKRKSKEQRYIDEYFSGSKTDSSAEGAEAELVKVCDLI